MQKCRICGYERASLSKHIRSEHNMTTKDYREIYPGEQVISNKQLGTLLNRNKSDSMRQVIIDRNKSDKMRAIISERNRDPEFIAKCVEGNNHPDVIAKRRETQSRISTELWKCDDYRKRVSESVSQSMSEYFEDNSEARARMSRQARDQWKDPEFREMALKNQKGGVFGHPVRYDGYYFRSQGEYEFYLAIKELGATDIQYESEHIDYGDGRTYIPDFKFSFEDETYIIEVKYSESSDEFEDKVQGALKHCESLGWVFGWVRRFVEIPKILETRSLESCRVQA